ncbi:hypothetical protein E4U41_006615 [Claviceps citrina]|nr:hypothetical protein E4U41_006615 [Claviceps citrina]
MGLTPVRVRGKRKRRRKTSSSTTSNLATDHHNNNPLRRQKMKRSLASVRASRSSRGRPTLQGLPVELLESILLHSASLALPRSSPLLGAKLSGRATLLRLFIVAFRDTWDQCLDLCTPRRFEGDASLQSDLLEMPWVNIDFILQAQQAWADRYARDRRYLHLHRPPVFAGEGDKRHPYHLHQNSLDHKDGHPPYNSRACFEADYAQALKWSAFRLLPRFAGRRDVHPLVRMPTDLITGPWDEEKRRRLFWLTRGGIELDEDDGRAPIPWEVKLACLDAAVISAEKPDPLIINCLLGPCIYSGLPEDAARKQLVRLSRRIEWGGDLPETNDILRRTARRLNHDLQLPEYDDI